MKSYTRGELDALGAQIKPSIIKDLGDRVVVNGALGMYELVYPKSDRSVLPCLTGEIGGMPGAWENWITAWHTRNFEKYDTYIDVGANGGYFAGLAATYGLTVIAIEANPVYAECLKAMVRHNKFDDFAVVEKAISDKDGEVTLVVPEELHGGASIAGRETNLSGNSIKADAVTLSGIDGPASAKILVKMDIEGAEEMAFDGAAIFNDKFRPTYIVEYTPRHYSEKFFDKLEKYGEVTMVDFSGMETGVTKAEADASEDWITLVVRPR